MHVMETSTRFIGSSLSLLGTLIQLGIVAAPVPRVPRCLDCRPPGPAPEPSEAVDTWRPFIENPGRWESGRRKPECPEPRGREQRYDLAAAPLPAGYDPHSFGARRVYACVLVGGDGATLAARMAGGTGRAGLDRRLLETIRRTWRFKPDSWAEDSASWQRIRLDSGPVDGSVRQPRLHHF